MVAIAAIPPAAAQGRPAPERQVLLVTAPALRWADIDEHDLPNIERFLAGADVAKLSMRTLGARTSIGEGYATIGAGTRASASASEAGLALEPFEPFEVGVARHAYERRTGVDARGRLLHLAFPSIERLNSGFLYGAEPGALGDALAAEGLAIGVVANGDVDLAVPPLELEELPVPSDTPEGEEVAPAGDESLPEEPTVEEPTEPEDVTDDDDEPVPAPVRFVESDYGRSAVLAAMDGTGQVPRGEVDSLLARDADVPYGVAYDPGAVTAAVDALWADTALAVVELSDLDRADAYKREADRDVWADLWAGALQRSDELFGQLVDAVPDGTTVVLATPAAPRSAESLGVFAIDRPGAEGSGLARSGTTRRPGYVQLVDIAPTILRIFDVDVPDSMTGTRITRAERATVDADLIDDFATSTEVTIFRDKATGPVSVVFVVAQILAYALAVVAVTRRQRWIGPVSFLALVILATPPVVFVAGLLELRRGGPATYVLGVFAVAIVLAALAEALGVAVASRWSRTRALVAPLSLIGLTWVVLVADVLTGGRLQINTVFGYSPIVAGRFAGFGNLAFALVAMSAVVVATGGWGLARLLRGRADGRARPGRPAVLAMVLFLAATVVVDGAPAWGSDVGGVLATVPAFAVLVLVALDVRLDWRRAVLIGAATAVTISVFAAIDLARPEDERTHLGRLVARVLDSEEAGGGLGEVLLRKINANISILTSSIWTWTIPFALGLLVYLSRRQRGFLRDLQEEVPGIRSMLAGGLLVAVLGFALNDSGVAVPAMMFAVLLPYLTYVLLRWDPARP